MLHTYICILLSNRYAPVDLICFTISHPSLLLGMEVGLNNGGISFTRKDTQRIKTTELPAKYEPDYNLDAKYEPEMTGQLA